MLDWDALLLEKPAAPAVPVPMDEEPAGHDHASAAAIRARQQAGDDRRRCAECGDLGERGNCLAAQRGEIKAPRGYVPIRDILRRCEGFRPMACDPDQRPGRDRWPGLIHGAAGRAGASPEAVAADGMPE